LRVGGQLFIVLDAAARDTSLSFVELKFLLRKEPFMRGAVNSKLHVRDPLIWTANALNLMDQEIPCSEQPFVRMR
jgi:hypothetical protein